MALILINHTMPVGEHIIRTQNEQRHIEQLSAQKEIYSTAKGLFYAQCVIATLVPVLISTLQTIFPSATESFMWVFGLYSANASITEVILDRIITKLKNTAASIQEAFDCAVLGIEWNSVLVPEKPLLETIQRYHAQYTEKKSVNKLYDWYSIEIAEVQTNIGTVICQRTNCVYDFSIRKKYSAGMGILAVITFIVLLSTSAMTGLTLPKFIVNVIAPSIPIFMLAIRQYFANADSIDNLKSLKSLLEGAILNASIDSTISGQSIRQIQDKIYNNRTLSPLLPDWVFKRYRSKLESQMHYSVRQIISDIKSRNTG